jgi:hypothetical protein
LIRLQRGRLLWEKRRCSPLLLRSLSKTTTGAIFEFNFGDSILQMCAAFPYELSHGKPLKKFAGCVTPEETALSHRLLTAALESQRQGATVAIRET